MLEEKEFCDSSGICDEGHLFNGIIWKVVWCSTNIFLSNYVKKKNDNLSAQKNLAARKAVKRKQDKLGISISKKNVDKRSSDDKSTDILGDTGSI